MFESQIGKTMEVYIDDMLVKSQVGIDHIHDSSMKWELNLNHDYLESEWHVSIAF